jgi:sulfur carrier protein
MQVLINQIPHELPAGATLAQAAQTFAVTGPFAAAVNLQFVPRAQYANTVLVEGDRIEFISPVTGG